MEKELRPGRRTSASLLGKISVVVLKTLAALVLIALLAVFVTSVSPIYDFAEPRPFSGPDIFNPYRDGGDSAFCWKRANFHTHTRVKGILNECEHWPDETDAAYRKFGYDIVTFSNHNELTVHPYDPLLQVNVFDGYGTGLCGLLDCKDVFSKLFRSICISIDDGRHLEKTLLSIAQISS